MSRSELVLEILHDQVKPALGCTEPGAVALAVARARDLLGVPVTSLAIQVDKNILKNGMDVGIPGTNERGIVFAAALSLVAGKAEYNLEVLRDVSDEDISRAMELVQQKLITLTLDESADGLTIRVDARGEGATSRVVIQNSHTNIVFEQKNSEILLNLEHDSAQPQHKPETRRDLRSEIQQFTMDELTELAQTLEFEQLAFLQDGIDMNRRIAQAGISQVLGVGMGRYLSSTAQSPTDRAKAITAAASEARMAGWPLPVMSSAGSGNHGLVAILPIVVIGESLGCTKEQTVRAIALSHFVTIFVKSYLGALSPVCGCGVAAGVGCAAGLVLLRGGCHTQVHAAINNMAAGITGMICDGAKLGCSYKLSIAVDAAVDAANMALAGITIPADNGILGATAEETVKNLAQVSGLGMNNTDRVILDVMLRKCM